MGVIIVFFYLLTANATLQKQSSRIIRFLYLNTLAFYVQFFS